MEPEEYAANVRADAARLYLSGMSMNAVGGKLGVHGQTVKRWIEAEGVDLRYERPTYPKEVKDEARRLYLEEELSAAAVAGILGVKCFTVKQWMTDEGVMRSMSESACISVGRKPRGRVTSKLWYKGKKDGKLHCCDSSYEYLRMGQLDLNPAVASWSRCSIRVPYIAPCGKKRTYNPDLHVILLTGEVRIEEIKPASMVADPINQAKFSACRAYCKSRHWSFSVLSEKDVGYVRAIAPHASNSEDRRKRRHRLRKEQFANESIEKRSIRLEKNAAYMRGYLSKRRSAKKA